jgi:hypothetical protein
LIAASSAPGIPDRRVAPHAATDYITGRSFIMRAEIETIVDDIKRSAGLLRRHL